MLNGALPSVEQLCSYADSQFVPGQLQNSSAYMLCTLLFYNSSLAATM